MPQPRLPLSWRQLCLIAKEQRPRGPRPSWVDWKYDTQARAAALGYITPTAADTWAAMQAVDASHRTRHRKPSLTSRR